MSFSVGCCGKSAAMFTVHLTAFFAVIQILFLQSASALNSDDMGGPIVMTDKGPVRGLPYSLPEFGGISGTAYLGIPFAEPPIGRRRFRRPEPVQKPWTHVLNATKLPNTCYQTPDLFFGDEFPGSTMWNPNTDLSEDCLYINVWVPNKTPTYAKSGGSSSWPSRQQQDQQQLGGGQRRKIPSPTDGDANGKDPAAKKLAVMVWIFGGGFYSGTTTLDCYDGRIMAAKYDVVLISIAYRVGALGFLCFDDPSAPCNAGLYDQLLGIEWAQRNAEAFGGDPGNVTLFGESAGSVSVSLHLLSPLSRDKFHRAILQSGSANMPWATISMSEGRMRSEEFAITYLGCTQTTDVRALVDCLRRIEPAKLVEEQWVSRGILQFPFLPVVDGTFLPESPELMLEHRSFKPCPILIGFNRNEGSWFLVYELGDRLTVENTGRSPREPLEIRAGDAKVMPRDQFLLSVNSLFFYFPHYRHELNSSFARDAIAFQYTDWTATTQDDSNTNINALDSAIGDSNFVCPLTRFALAYAAAGYPVYMYNFSERYEASPWPQWMGVLHGDEILFMFGQVLREAPIVTSGGNWRLTYSAAEKRLSRAMLRYWTNFAKTGNPNTRFFSSNDRDQDRDLAVVEWPLHTASRREYMELNSRLLDEQDRSKVIGRAPRAKSCAFWLDYLPKLITSTADITDREKAWKLEFSEWTTRYIVDWKTQYDLYIKQQKDRCASQPQPPR